MEVAFDHSHGRTAQSLEGGNVNEVSVVVQETELISVANQAS